MPKLEVHIDEALNRLRILINNFNSLQTKISKIGGVSKESFNVLNQQLGALKTNSNSILFLWVSHFFSDILAEIIEVYVCFIAGLGCPSGF